MPQDNTINEHFWIESVNNDQFTGHDTQSVDGRTNIQRANRALAGITAYAEAGGPEDVNEPVHYIVSDFLTDLMHLCRMNGLDFERLTERARGNHDAESEE